MDLDLTFGSEKVLKVHENKLTDGSEDFKTWVIFSEREKLMQSLDLLSLKPFTVKEI